MRDWVGFVPNVRSCHWNGPPNHPPLPPNRLETRQENPNFLCYILGQKDLKLFELALEAPPAPDPAIWGIFQWVLGHWMRLPKFCLYSHHRILHQPLWGSNAGSTRNLGYFSPICGLKIIKKKKQFAHFLQNSTQNPTESELCTHSHVYTHRDGRGVQGRCRHCPTFLGNTLGDSKRKKPQNCPPRSPSPWQSPWLLPSLQLAPQNPFFPYFISFWLVFFCCLPPTCSALPTQMELWEVVSMDPALLWPGKTP